MIRTIHAALDFDEPSVQALIYANAFAKKLQATLRAVHVSDDDHDRVMNQLVEGLAKAGVEAEPKVMGGRPSETILDYAPNADLTIVGTHRRTGLAGLFLGSVAERIVRGSRGAVLVVPHDQKRLVPPKKILVAVDFSDASNAAFTIAATLARSFDGEICALHIVEQIPGMLGTEVLGSPARTNTQFESYYEVVARRAKAPLDALVDGTDNVTTVIRVAHPVEGICNRAQDTDTDLIVMGTRGRSGLAHFGSVAERTLRRAPCPVLVVHQP